MRTGLVRMGVVTALRDVKDPCWQSPTDQLRHQFQTVAQLRGWVLTFRADPTGNRANLVGADLRIERGALEKIERRAGMIHWPRKAADGFAGVLGHLDLGLVQLAK